MKHLLRLLFFFVLLPQISFAQQNPDPSKRLIEALEGIIDGTEPISYFFNDSIICTDIDGNKRWLCDMEILKNEIVPTYRYTRFKIRQGKAKDTYVISNACSRHHLLIDYAISEDVYVDYKIRRVDEKKKSKRSCYQPPRSKDISNRKTNNAMENAIADIVKAFVENDNELINSYIHKEYKTAFLYKIGLPGCYTIIDTLDLHSNSNYLAYYEASEPYYQLTYEPTPVYDCGWDMWTKPGGLYCSQPGEGTLLRSNIKYYVKYGEADANSVEVKSLIDREERSRRVVLNYGDNSLAFSIIAIAGKWYLSILDCQGVDCSA